MTLSKAPLSCPIAKARKRQRHEHPDTRAAAPLVCESGGSATAVAGQEATVDSTPRTAALRLAAAIQKILMPKLPAYFCATFVPRSGHPTNAYVRKRLSLRRRPCKLRVLRNQVDVRVMAPFLHRSGRAPSILLAGLPARSELVPDADRHLKHVILVCTEVIAVCVADTHRSAWRSCSPR